MLIALAVTPSRVDAMVVAPADAIHAGNLRVLMGDDSGRVASAGGSADPFTLELPAGAECPGDSANDNWRVNGFMIPTSVDPGSLKYASEGPDGPEGDALWALYQVDTVPYAAVLTEPNERSGEPGRIPALPALTLAVFAPNATEYIAPGAYTVGVACSLWGDTKLYWTATLSIAADPSDQPAGIRWVVERRSETDGDSALIPDSSGAHPWLVAGPLIALLTAAGLLVLLVRRGTPQASKGTP